MITDEPQDDFPEVLGQVNWNTAFEREIHDITGQPLRFRDLFTLPAKSEINDKSDAHTNLATSPPRFLIIFIRHFFCGNCQEYLRRLVAERYFSPHYLAERNIRIAIIGCGASSLISSYREVTDIPPNWHIYTDSTTELYRLLGMHRTLSLGKRNPRYIKRSLTSGMLQSIVQGMKRIPEGDVMAAGSLNVNGGEFLFELAKSGQRHPQAEDWKLNWCHRMRNSRDHTEVDILLRRLALSSKLDAVVAVSPKPPNKRTQSAPLKLSADEFIPSETPSVITEQPDVTRSTFRRSLSKRRQSWLSTAERFVRSDSKRRSMTLQLKDSNKIATTVLTHTS